MEEALSVPCGTEFTAIVRITRILCSALLPVRHPAYRLPASDVQVSNLDTRDSAAEYAVSFGLEVVAPSIH